MQLRARRLLRRSATENPRCRKFVDVRTVRDAVRTVYVKTRTYRRVFAVWYTESLNAGCRGEVCSLIRHQEVQAR